MRIAVLADIHGNLPAFEAAAAHAAAQRVDHTLIAGDIVVGSPDSLACWRFAQSLGYPILRGNHERYVAHYGTPQAGAQWNTEQFAPVRWAVGEFSDEERRALGELPPTLRVPGADDLLVVHASLRDDRDTVAAYTPEEQLAPMFPGLRERVVVRAHNHLGQIRLWSDRMIVTAGSVGLPLDGAPTAQYLIIEGGGSGWRVYHQSVPYDLDATLRRFHETGYLEATGPMGRLYMREVATAGPQIVPFLRAYARWSRDGDIALADAVDKFLTRY